MEGGLLTTGLPGKPLGTFLFAHFHLSVPSQLSALVFKRYLGRGAFGTLDEKARLPRKGGCTHEAVGVLYRD